MVVFFVKAMIYLGVMSLLGAGVMFFMKKRGAIGSRGGNADFKVLMRLPIGFKRELLIVKVGNKKLLLGSTESNITLLWDMEEEELGGFQRVLERRMEGR